MHLLCLWWVGRMGGASRRTWERLGRAQGVRRMGRDGLSIGGLTVRAGGCRGRWKCDYPTGEAEFGNRLIRTVTEAARASLPRSVV